MDLANVQQSLESSEEMNKTLQTQLEKSLIISEPDVSKIQNESSLSSKVGKQNKKSIENIYLDEITEHSKIPFVYKQRKRCSAYILFQVNEINLLS